MLVSQISEEEGAIAIPAASDGNMFRNPQPLWYFYTRPVDKPVSSPDHRIYDGVFIARSRAYLNRTFRVLVEDQDAALLDPSKT